MYLFKFNKKKYNAEVSVNVNLSARRKGDEKGWMDYDIKINKTVKCYVAWNKLTTLDLRKSFCLLASLSTYATTSLSESPNKFSMGTHEGKAKKNVSGKQTTIGWYSNWRKMLNDYILGSTKNYEFEQ